MPAQTDSGIFKFGSTNISFYIIPCRQKKDLAELITQHGGVMSQQRREALYHLYNPGDIVSNRLMVSSDFITDCIAKGKLLDVELYRYTARYAIEKKQSRKAAAEKRDAEFVFDDLDTRSSDAGSSSGNLRSGAFTRYPFTIGEDMSIIQAVLKESKFISINGTRIWETLVARKVTSRTSSSMKERFLKKILPFIDNYDLSAVEIRKLKTLSSSKTVEVLKTLRPQRTLPFLRAPTPEPSPTISLISSSSEESVDDVALVPLRPVKRKAKSAVISLSSNSDPSSQSSKNATQSQRNKRGSMQHQINDSLAAGQLNQMTADKHPSGSPRRRTITSRLTRNISSSNQSAGSSQSPNLSARGGQLLNQSAGENWQSNQSARDRQPPNQSSKDKQSSNQSARGSQSLNQSVKGNRSLTQLVSGNRTANQPVTKSSSSQRSYVIEESSPEQSGDLPLSAESVDMELLGSPKNKKVLPKVSIKLTDVLERIAKPSTSTPMKRKQLRVSPTTHSLNTQKNSNEVVLTHPSSGKKAKLSTRKYESRSSNGLKESDNHNKNSPIAETQPFSFNADFCGGMKAPTSSTSMGKPASKTADDTYPCTQPFTVSDEPTPATSGDSPILNKSDSQSVNVHEESRLSSRSSLLFDLADLAQAAQKQSADPVLSPASDNDVKFVHENPPASLQNPPTSLQNPPASASLPPASASLPPASASLPPASASLPSVNVPPVYHSRNNSDEFFKSQIMLDGMEMEDEFWPCRSPISPTLEMCQGNADFMLPASNPCPAARIDHSTQRRTFSGGTHNTQLSWSTFDFSSQRSNNQTPGSGLSTTSPNDNVNQNNSQPNLARSAYSAFSPRLPKFLQKITFSSGTQNPDKSGMSDAAEITSQSSIVQPQSSLGSGENGRERKSATRPFSKERQSEKSCKEPAVDEGVVQQSWSSEEDLLEISVEEEPIKPKAPRRTNRLREVINQPMRDPQFVDANSTAAMSQSSAYVDCLSHAESSCSSSDVSFKSATEAPTGKQLLDESTTSVVKAEPLANRYSSTSNRSPVTRRSKQPDSVPLLATLCSTKPVVAGNPKQPITVPLSERLRSTKSVAAGTSTQPDMMPLSGRWQSTKSVVAGTSAWPDGVALLRRPRSTESVVAGTSRQPDTVLLSERPPQLYIEKCKYTECEPQNGTRICHINVLKNHALYSKLMFTYGVEDKYMLPSICGFSGDWQLLEQHLISGQKVGNMWTERDDRLLYNPSLRKKHMKELRKKFKSSEIKNRKQFLLEYADLTPKNRKDLLGLRV